MINYTGYTENYHDGFDPWFKRKTNVGGAFNPSHPFKVVLTSTGYKVHPGLVFYTKAADEVWTQAPMKVAGSTMSFNPAENVLTGFVNPGYVYLDVAVTDTSTHTDAGDITLTSCDVKLYSGATLPTNTKSHRYFPIALLAGASIIQELYNNVHFEPTWDPQDVGDPGINYIYRTLV